MAALGLTLRIDQKSHRTPTGTARMILRAITLTLIPGEVTALVGPSGCGKSSLMRIAAGLDPDFIGHRTWLGHSAPRIGMVFQEPRLLPWRTVRQNILLAQTTENPGLADHLLARLGLAACADAWPATLSLGMARRAAIARALAVEPDLLLLDEPFASLDPAMVAQVHALLAEIWQARPIATLLITHDRAEAASIAHHILDLTPHDLTGSPQIEPHTNRHMV
jgi:NitT/TauT family transport system ATP-binding protein